MIKFFIENGYSVKAPVREFGNAGCDFFIPALTPVFKEAFEAKNDKKRAELFQSLEGEWCICIKPHCDVNIPTGIRCRISPNIALEAQNKSGVATKNKLIYGASTIDASYQGIIHCHLINSSNNDVILPLGTKIIQFIPRIIDLSPIEVVTDCDFDKFYENFEFSNRGEGAFGSTGLK